MTLLIAMPGPPLPEGGPAAGVSLPELPALTRLLTAARRLADASDWRAGVLRWLGAADVAWPHAATAACNVPALGAGASLCRVAPLHVVAGISRVHLPPEGLLALGEEERAAWREAFNAEFGTADIVLHTVPGGWLLAAPFAAAARDTEPEMMQGLSLERAAAASQPERALRRLGAEIEMWLAGHALNRAREEQRQLPLNCLWFSGGVELTRRPAITRPPDVVLGPALPDPWTSGLAHHCNVPCEVAEGWVQARRSSNALVVPAAVTAVDATRQWEALEAGWFAPAWQAWRDGDLGALHLQIGASSWQLPQAAPWRWLRRRRAWWQAVRT